MNQEDQIDFDPDEGLRTGKAAKLLGVRIQTVQAWIRSGRLPATRTAGGEFRVRRGDIDLLLLQGRLTIKQKRGKKLY